MKTRSSPLPALLLASALAGAALGGAACPAIDFENHLFACSTDLECRFVQGESCVDGHCRDCDEGECPGPDAATAGPDAAGAGPDGGGPRSDAATEWPDAGAQQVDAGTTLYFNVTLPDDTVEYRAAVPLPGGEQSKVETTTTKKSPLISPDRKYLLYVVGLDALWMKQLATGAETDLKLSSRLPLDWHPSGLRLLYQEFEFCSESVSEATLAFGADGVPTVESTRVVIEQVTSRPVLDTAYSPEGDRIVTAINMSHNCAGGYRNQSILVAPLSALPVPEASLKTLADESHYNVRGVWSADGKAVYWWRSATKSILRRPADASAPEVTVASVVSGGSLAAPPPGYAGPYVLAFTDSDGAGGEEIFLLRSDGTRDALGVGANKGVHWPMAWRR